jgi:hypothetical protein
LLAYYGQHVQNKLYCAFPKNINLNFLFVSVSRLPVDALWYKNQENLGIDYLTLSEKPVRILWLPNQPLTWRGKKPASR